MNLQFSDPNYLYVALLAPVALGLALLIKRRRRRVVPSVAVWKKLAALPDLKVKRKLFDAEAFAAFLLPLLAALAMSSPSVTINGNIKKIVLLVDTSSSMASRGCQGATRLEHAASVIRKLAEREGNVSFSLHATGASEVLAESSDVEEITGPLFSEPLLPVSDEVLKNRFAAVFAEAGREHAPVVWISDRPAGESYPRLLQIIVGDVSNNVGLINVRFTASSGKPAIFATVGNFSSARRRISLYLEQDGRFITAVPAVLDSGMIRAFTIYPMKNQGYDMAKGLNLFLRFPGLEEDDFEADNGVVLSSPLARSAAVDGEKYPRVKLALEKAAHFRAVELSNVDEAKIAVLDEESGALPRSGILLLAPEKPCCGLLQLDKEKKVSGARVAEGVKELSAGCVQGLDEFSLRGSILPAGARVLATADDGEKRIPLVAGWEWRGRKVVYLGTVPAKWTGSPGFPLMISEIADMLVPHEKQLPGVGESDNRLTVAATGDIPPLPVGDLSDKAIPLGRTFALLAFFAAVFLMSREILHMKRQKQE